jgi:hypothetical protein
LSLKNFQRIFFFEASGIYYLPNGLNSGINFSLCPGGAFRYAFLDAVSMLLEPPNFSTFKSMPGFVA